MFTDVENIAPVDSKIEAISSELIFAVPSSNKLWVIIDNPLKSPSLFDPASKVILISIIGIFSDFEYKTFTPFVVW